MNRLFVNSNRLAHRFIMDIITPGAQVIDATAGNGNDTCFLAGIVGQTGQVYAFDIQAEAINRTAERLDKAGLSERVQLILAGHEHMTEYVREQVSVVMFNLGYLPRGEHAIITKPQSTIMALEGATNLVQVGGIITIVVYTGHQGALEESEVINKWISGLDQKWWDVLVCHHPNRLNDSPYLIVIQKTGEE